MKISYSFLKLSRNDITDACLFEKPNHILHFDLSYNLLWNIKVHCFANFKLLYTLILSNNEISYMSVHSFLNLFHLRFLDLSNNPIIFIPNYSFSNLPHLTLLNISLSVKTKISIIMFKNIRINPIIINTNFYITCVTPVNAICTLYPPWYVSCYGIIPNQELKIVFILIAVCIFIIGFCSISIQSNYHKPKRAFDLTSIAININDIIFLLYLVIILASSTVLLKVVHLSGLWTTHFLCFSAFAILLWFTILGQLLLIFMSISRYMVVSYPLKTQFKQIPFTIKCIFVMYGFSLMLSLFITLLFKQISKFVPLDLCLPFVDPTNSVLIIKIITWFVVISQTAATVIIATMYILLYKKTKQTKMIKEAKSKKNTSSMIIHLVIITFSNILCWFPTNITYIAAMVMTTYPIDLVLWTVITVLPCNSIINPLVFIISTLKKKH